MKKVSALALIICFILSGCSFFSFDDSEDIPTYVPPSASDITEVEPLSCQDALTNEAGSIIATYEAFVPQFSETGERKEAIRRINSYYKAEIRALNQDMQDFFSYVKTLGDSEDAAYVTSDYELLPASPEYVCVMRTYSMYQKGVLSVHPSCQLFLTDTGWRLSFSELFGENEDAALELLKANLKDWCAKNSLPDHVCDDINADTLFNRFGICENSLYVCLQPFSVAANDPQSYVAELPLAPFSELFN